MPSDKLHRQVDSTEQVGGVVLCGVRSARAHSASASPGLDDSHSVTHPHTHHHHLPSVISTFGWR